MEITSGACLVLSECLAITLVSIAENELAKRVRLFSNPSSGQMQISLSHSYPLLQVQLLGEEGKILVQKDFANQQEIFLDLAPYPSAIYFVRIFSGEEQASYMIRKE